MPTDIMVPRTSSNGGPHVIDLKLVAADGVVFGARLPESAEPADAGEMLTVHVRSRRFGMAVSTAISRARVMARHRDLVAMAVLGTGATALIILLLAFGALRRPDDPLSALAEAIRNGELVPYYQPILDLTTARVVSAEVLVRWRKPDGSLVPPAQFIPLAEASGLVVDLTRALMRRVCAEAGAAIGARPAFRIGFNLSARHFMDETIVDDVRSIFGSVADCAEPGPARGHRAPGARQSRRCATRHRGAAGPWRVRRDRRCRHRSQRPVVHAQARRRFHQDR